MQTRTPGVIVVTATATLIQYSLLTYLTYAEKNRKKCSYNWLNMIQKDPKN